MSITGFFKDSSGLRHTFPKMEQCAFLSVRARMDSKTGAPSLEFQAIWGVTLALTSFGFSLNDCLSLLGGEWPQRAGDRAGFRKLRCWPQLFGQSYPSFSLPPAPRTGPSDNLP